MTTMLAPLSLSLLLAVLCAAEHHDSSVDVGEQFCEKIVDPDAQSECLTCFREAANGKKNDIKRCARDWLSPQMAKCASKQSDAEFESCMAIAGEREKVKEKRTNTLVNVGQPQLRKVMDSQLVQGAGPAVFSILCQELFITDENLIALVDDLASECFTRFVLDSKDETWHLHHTNASQQGRQNARASAPKPAKTEGIARSHLVYSYGQMGVDMPFHGVGPLAVDILKGKCIFEKLAEAGKLDLLVEMALNSPYPVPSWFFQDILASITSITLPN
ncbi:uncharacterized protein LOC125031517 [Penaeus chinensis]|uniref:uncharacterized protein LOC125031517 n=1 Tax=Penaeus chinensis TaxID=139456 RepID=UPI001FB6E1B8|nr:uncharacterized protein LOC125031517 [Penaeus chinensis]